MGCCSNLATISKDLRSAETNEINDGTDIDTETDSRSTSNTWVKNPSDKPLTEAQENLLTYWPKFTIISKCPPNGEYIMAIEQVCSKLNQGDAEEIGVEVKNVLKKTHLPKSNITKKSFKPSKN